MKPTSRIKLGLVVAALGLTSIVGTDPLSRCLVLAQDVNQSTISAAPLAPGQLANQKLHQARKAVAVRDIATAERLLGEVQAMRLTYGQNEDRPELVAGLIQQYKQVINLGQTAGNTDQFRRQYARLMLEQAATMLHRSELDLAQQLTQEAANQNTQYNQAEKDAGLEPAVMSKRIADARRAADWNHPNVVVRVPVQPISQASQEHLAKAQQILQQARGALNAGQIDQAEQLARSAQGYNLPENVFPLGGDTPNRLLAEVGAIRSGIRQQVAPVAPNVGNPILQTAAVSQQPMLAPQLIQQGQPVSYLDKTVAERQAIISQITADVMQKIADAQRVSQQQRKPEAGLEILQATKVKVQASALDAETKTMFVRQIDKAIEETVNFMERYASQSKQDEINKAVLAERRQSAEQFRNKEERLQAFFNECNKLIEQQRYEEAVMVAKKAKEFAPDEPATNILLTSTQLAYNFRRSSQIRDQKWESNVDALLAVDQATIIPDFDKNPLHYNTNWSDLTKRRRASNASMEHQRPESERQILRQLEMSVSMNADKPMPLEQALKLLCSQAGVQMYLDEAALRDNDVLSGTMVKVPPTNDIRLKSALNIVLDQLGLAYVVKNEMLNITTKKRAKGEKYQKAYYIGDVVRKVPQQYGDNPMSLGGSYSKAIGEHRNLGNSKQPAATPGFNDLTMNRNVLGNANVAQVGANGDPNIMGQALPIFPQAAGPAGGSGRGSRGGSSSSGSSSGGGSGSGNELDFGAITDIIESIVEPDSWEEGDAAMVEYEANQCLVIRQTEEVHSQIADLLTQLRKMNDLQVAVEVRYITLSDSFYEIMGMDFDMRFRNDGAAGRMTTTTLGGTTTGTTGTSTSTTGTTGTTTGTTTTTTRGNNATVGLSAANMFSADASIPMMQNSYDLALMPMFGAAQPQVGLQTGFALLNDIEAYFFLSAAQGDQRSSVLQAPKVMIYNGSYGIVQDTTTTPSVISVTPYVGDFAAGYQPIITMLNEGQLLTVHAQVSNDRQHVRMTLSPTFTKIIKMDTFKYFGDDEDSEETETAEKGDDVAKLETASLNSRDSKRTKTKRSSGITLQQPTVAQFSVMTTANCPDGGTVVLGGIKRLSEGRREAGTPILNKIPYIQRLFSNTSIGRDTQTVMMMVTPRIIIQEEEELHIMGSSTMP